MTISRSMAAGAFMLFAFASAVSAEVKTKEIALTHGGTTLPGLMAWDDAAKGKRPGVLVVHGGWGYTDNVRNQAKRLAASGYVALAFDWFGVGKVATQLDHAGAPGRTPAVEAARFNAALEQLKKDALVDPSKTAAIGYCMGGTLVLNMARAGTDLDAAVVFHGALDTKTPARKGQVKPRVLVLNGGADPHVPVEQVEPFKQEMQSADANFEVVIYPGVQHAYGNPDADKNGLKGAAYNAQADKTSWAAMLKLFAQVFP